MPTERMASSDAAWLHMDRSDNLMLVNSVAWTERPLDWDSVTDAVRSRLLPAFPRFSQRVLDPAMTFGLIGPRWADVDGFDVRDHLHRCTLPAPGGDAELHAHVSRRAADPLDSSRPLWEADLIDGYRGGSAVLLRTHHAMADGTALVQAMLSMVDPPAGGGVHDDQRSHRVPAGRLAAAADEVRSWPGSLPGPDELARHGSMLRRLVGSPADEPSPLRGPLSGNKQLTWSGSIPLEPVRATGRAHGATVNDLALAAVTGALGRYLHGRGVEVRRVSAAVPINLRPGDRPFDARRGNQFGLAFVPLPVDEPKPVERLRRVKAAMDEAKKSGEGRTVQRALAVMGHLPTPAEQRFIDGFAGRASAVVTNITGPREQVSLAGVPIAGFLAWVPCTGPIGVGLSICSYAGRLTLGVAVDTALVPEADDLLAALSDEVSDLRQLADPVHSGPEPEPASRIR
jgi:WS/DGAT/MGAT family acyltransferase